MSSVTRTNRWPKALPMLTEEQTQVREDFMRHWLEVLPKRYGLVEKFNHQYPLRTLMPGVKTLEIGTGRGAHLQFENLETQKEYVALELRPELAEVIRASYPTCYRRLLEYQRRRIWQKIQQELMKEAYRKGKINLNNAYHDGSVVKSKRGQKIK